MITNKDITKELWRRGDLSYLCHTVQLEMRSVFQSSPSHSTLVWLLSRQIGKTTLLAILAFEQCLKKPNSLVIFVTDTKEHAKTILNQKIEETLLTNCPPEFKPEFREKDYLYRFPNGSVIRLAGSDNKHFERLRGPKADLVLVDEAGFCSDLQYMVKHVLFPTTTHTRGKIILSSTLPRGEHDFDGFVERAKLDNLLTIKTIDDNPLLTQEQRDAIVKTCGGVDSPEYKQEYLCLKVKDEDNSPIPEVNAGTIMDITTVGEKPLFYHTYLSMDIGGVKDFTGILFGYYDFKRKTLVIQDEILIKNREFVVRDVIIKIKDKMKANWTNDFTQEINYPYRAVSDHNEIVLNEMRIHSDYKINFKFAKKDNKKASISTLRSKLREGTLRIDRKCIDLLRQLEFCKWSNSQKEDFGRDSQGGHYDLVDSLLYMIRSIEENVNPYPNHYGRDMTNLYINNKQQFNSTKSPHTSNMAKVLKGMYGRK